MEYEQAFSQWLNGGYARAFWKGRVALYAILRALGIGPDDEVILPGYTCLVDATPIKYLGGRPVYVDIEPETFNIDVSQLEDAITPRTKAIVAQHTYGYLVDMDAVMEIAGRHSIPVVEDCCHTLGSSYKGKLAGTFGIVSYFSSQWNKPYTTGLGGMAVCHDPQLAREMQQLCQCELQPVPLGHTFMLASQFMMYRAFVYPRTTAFVQAVFRWLSHKSLVIGSSSCQELEKPVMPPDFFMGISDFQARVGLKQLRKLGRNIEHRRKIALLYDRLLTERGWQIIRVPKDTDPVLVRYPVRVTDKDAAIAAANKHGIELGAWFVSPLHDEVDNIEMYDYAWGMCPEAEKAAREVVNLPLHLRASEATARRTVEFISRFRQAV